MQLDNQRKYPLPYCVISIGIPPSLVITLSKNRNETANKVAKEENINELFLDKAYIIHEKNINGLAIHE